jgi:hypothetical protein
LISYAAGNENVLDGEAPVVGSSTEPSKATSTSGEVNLYKEPSTFGTSTPILYADCEGLDGGEPVCSKHQKHWSKYGRSYVMSQRHSSGESMDRKTAVNTIYPRFLYIFSDVICMVTSNPRLFGNIATRLMKWSEQGAKKSLNQYALPAVIIIINKSTTEYPEWIGEDTGQATRDFFKRTEGELNSNNDLKALAEKVC